MQALRTHRRVDLPASGGRPQVRLVCGIAVSLVLAACTNAIDGKSPQEPEGTGMTNEERLEARKRLQRDRRPDAVPEKTAAPITGEVPEALMDAIMRDLEGRLGTDRSGFEVLQAEAVQWNDGALGCPKPDEAYTQAITDGYIVVIRFDGRTYDYRATERGYFRLCDGFNPAR